MIGVLMFIYFELKAARGEKRATGSIFDRDWSGMIPVPNPRTRSVMCEEGVKSLEEKLESMSQDDIDKMIDGLIENCSLRPRIKPSNKTVIDSSLLERAYEALEKDTEKRGWPKIEKQNETFPLNENFESHKKHEFEVSEPVRDEIISLDGMSNAIDFYEKLGLNIPDDWHKWKKELEEKQKLKNN